MRVLLMASHGDPLAKPSEVSTLLVPIDVPPTSTEQRRCAQLAVCRAATDTDDARLLLDALGLLDVAS